MNADPHLLDRFVTAQEPVRAQVESELAQGTKRSHWMWFVFPQLRGLGRSATAHHFGLASVEEARAFWRHPVLGPRLRRHTALVLGHAGRSALQIFGRPDDLKFQSCMTLFDHVAGDEPAFGRALEAFYAGARDPQTLALLQAPDSR